VESIKNVEDFLAKLFRMSEERTITTGRGRMLIDADNRADLAIYQAMMAEHRRVGCGAAPLCPGRDVYDLLNARATSHGKAYQPMLLLTALSVLIEQEEEIAALQAQIEAGGE
jgi:hypothetical protein